MAEQTVPYDEFKAGEPLLGLKPQASFSHNNSLSPSYLKDGKKRGTSKPAAEEETHPVQPFHLSNPLSLDNLSHLLYETLMPLSLYFQTYSCIPNGLTSSMSDNLTPRYL